MRNIRTIQATLLCACAAASIGCGKIEVPLNLAIAGDSNISIDLATFPPPFNHLETSLVGGVETTAIIDFNHIDLIRPKGIAAMIRIDDLLIAGYPIEIGGFLNTGTVCGNLDPVNASGGIALIQPFRHQMNVQMTMNTVFRVTNPALAGLNPDGLPFPAEVDATIPITLAELFKLFVGLLGGGSGGFTGLELTQEISTTLPADIQVFGGAQVTATLTLASVDAIPADPLLADCVQ